MQGLCRDCGASLAQQIARCPQCNSPRCVFAPDLHELTIAHIDCDAFFAAIEKRDNPQWRERPVIVGGGQRGVVSTACYLARIKGVRSAMPMFRAKRLCPDAIIVRPSFAKYRQAAQALREMMCALTPQVQAASIDEAYLDLAGTQRLHKASPAQSLAKLALMVEDTIGITISIGLSYNKRLAKLASDQDKPRGFFVLGKDTAVAFLAQLPVQKIGGIGAASAARLGKKGITTLGQIQALSQEQATQMFGKDAPHWQALAWGIDPRPVSSQRAPAKSISTETTFAQDIGEKPVLEKALWQLAEKLALRCREQGLGGQTLTLKLKRADFTSYTRAQKLEAVTRLPKQMFSTATQLLGTMLAQQPKAKWRLLGLGLSQLASQEQADLPDLANPYAGKEVDLQNAIDELREKYDITAVQLGRGFTPKTQNHKERKT